MSRLPDEFLQQRISECGRNYPVQDCAALHGKAGTRNDGFIFDLFAVETTCFKKKIKKLLFTMSSQLAAY